MSIKLPKPEDIEKMAEQLAPLMQIWMKEIQSPLYQEKMLAIAMERMVKYKSHIKAGFTETQALDLICK